MRVDPDIEQYSARLAETYDDLNYGKSLSARFMRRGHVLLEKPYDSSAYFPRVVEVGSGAGEHVPFVRHRFDEYLLTDMSDHRLKRAHAALPDALRAKVVVAQEDATRLSLPDQSVDRLIACFILEHLLKPHEVLREWHRVVRKGGVLSILLPSDPGVLWRLGRMLGPRTDATRAGIDYDYWMAREHINAIGNLVVLIRYYFENVQETWYPVRFPSTDLNLFYLCQVVRT